MRDEPNESLHRKEANGFTTHEKQKHFLLQISLRQEMNVQGLACGRLERYGLSLGLRLELRSRLVRNEGTQERAHGSQRERTGKRQPRSHGLFPYLGAGREQEKRPREPGWGNGPGNAQGKALEHTTERLTEWTGDAREIHWERIERAKEAHWEPTGEHTENAPRAHGAIWEVMHTLIVNPALRFS